jgi:uncharacterized protein (TIGR00661 family)
MGNASRISAIIEAIQEKSTHENMNLSISVLSWGAGYRFLNNFKQSTQSNFELTEMISYQQNLNPIKFLQTYFKNTATLKSKINEFNPNIIIIDSDYHFLAHVFKSKKIFSISQAYDVLARAKINNYRPNKILESITFTIREKIDFLIQWIFSNKILVPSFTINNKITSKIYSIPLIVRKEFLGPKAITSESDTYAILLSGSEIEKDKFVKLSQQESLTLISPNPNQINIISHSAVLDEYEILITQGGLSSISEAIARKKFLVIFPIHNHPEQIINALEVERLGIGIIANNNDLISFSKFKTRILETKNKKTYKPLDCNGAEVAATIILNSVF